MASRGAYSRTCCRQSEDEIAKNLGRYSSLAPGGSVRVESFTHNNKVQRRGVPFGHKYAADDVWHRAALRLTCCGLPLG